jgi:hypothetical protein
MRRTWFLMLAAISATAQTHVINVEGKPFTEIIVSGTKPYLHPVRTASGQVISQSGPADHVHHRGLWFSHGDVNGWDFWANEPNQKGVGKGRGEILTKNVWVSGSTATLEADWVDGNRQPLLRERRIMTFSGGPNQRIIDFDATLTALTDAKFGDTKEGTFAIRLVDELTEKKGSGKLRSAEGAEGMNAIWGTASPWVDYSGTLNGEVVGVTIYDHPENPRYPTRWHARDYGLFAANIFGLHDFLRDKTKDGSLALTTGKSAQFRYRVVIHNGPGFDPAKHIPAR